MILMDVKHPSHSKNNNENEVDKNTCDYHLCSKKTKLYRCKYCGKYFCKNHIRPGLTISRSVIDSIKDRVLRDKVYEEWRRTDVHPDVVWTQKYFEEMKLKEEETRQKFFRLLDKWKEKPAESLIEKKSIIRPMLSEKVSKEEKIVSKNSRVNRIKGLVEDFFNTIRLNPRNFFKVHTNNFNYISPFELLFCRKIWNSLIDCKVFDNSFNRLFYFNRL